MSDKERHEDMGASAAWRGNVYLLLSRLYTAEVDGGLLSHLSSEEMSGALASLGLDISSMVPGLSDGADKLLEDLAEEYAALFLLPGGDSPYESVRLKGRLCDDPEQKVRGFYRDCGVVLDEDRKLFADHIGVELGFMGHLAGKEAEAWAAGDEEEAVRWLSLQVEFFTLHPGRWANEFLDDMEKIVRHPFYRMLAVLTRRFLETEREELAPDFLPGTDGTSRLTKSSDRGARA